MDYKKEFYKKVKLGKTTYDMYDFERIAKLPFKFFIFMTQRSAGKTYGGIEHLIDNWVNKGEKGAFLYNTDNQIKEGYHQWGADNRMNNPEKWEGLKNTKLGVVKGSEIVIYFLSVGSPYKSKRSRDSKVSTIMYDEFSEGLLRVGNKQSKNLDAICKSFVNTFTPLYELKAFLFSNNKGLAVPILSQLKLEEDDFGDGEFAIKQEEFLIFRPKFDVNILNKRNKMNRDYKVSMALGGMDEAYFNVSFKNNMENVIPSKEHKEYQGEPNFVIYTLEGTYLVFYDSLRNKEELFVKQFSEKEYDLVDVNIYTTRVIIDKTGTIYNPELRSKLMFWNMENLLYYANFNTKNQVKKEV